MASKQRTDDASEPATAVDAASRLRLRAAWMYHVENLTQSEVAKRLGVNRIAVVRMLADARRRREVRITIDAALADLIELERAVENRFGVEEVILAPMSDPQADPTPLIAAAAGAYISNEMDDNMTIGVGWGARCSRRCPISGAAR